MSHVFVYVFIYTLHELRTMYSAVWCGGLCVTYDSRFDPECVLELLLSLVALPTQCNALAVSLLGKAAREPTKGCTCIPCDVVPCVSLWLLHQNDTCTFQLCAHVLKRLVPNYCQQGCSCCAASCDFTLKQLKRNVWKARLETGLRVENAPGADRFNGLAQLPRRPSFLRFGAADSWALGVPLLTCRSPSKACHLYQTFSLFLQLSWR